MKFSGEDPQPDTNDGRLPPKDGQLMFKSGDAAMKRIRTPMWKPMSGNLSCPNSQKEKNDYAKKVVRAIQAMDELWDDDEYPTAKANLDTTNGIWLYRDLETAAHMIVDRCVDLHSKGASHQLIRRCPEMREILHRDLLFTFPQRIHFMTMLMAHSKVAVNMVLGGLHFIDMYLPRIWTTLQNLKPFREWWNSRSIEQKIWEIETAPYLGMKAKPPSKTSREQYTAAFREILRNVQPGKLTQWQRRKQFSDPLMIIGSCFKPLVIPDPTGTPFVQGVHPTPTPSLPVQGNSPAGNNFPKAQGNLNCQNVPTGANFQAGHLPINPGFQPGFNASVAWGPNTRGQGYYNGNNMVFAPNGPGPATLNYHLNGNSVPQSNFAPNGNLAMNPHFAQSPASMHRALQPNPYPATAQNFQTGWSNSTASESFSFNNVQPAGGLVSVDGSVPPTGFADLRDDFDFGQVQAPANDSPGMKFDADMGDNNDGLASGIDMERGNDIGNGTGLENGIGMDMGANKEPENDIQQLPSVQMLNALDFALDLENDADAGNGIDFGNGAGLGDDIGLENNPGLENAVGWALEDYSAQENDPPLPENSPQQDVQGLPYWAAPTWPVDDGVGGDAP